MRFPPSLLDEIRARLPVSDVIGRKVKLRRQGREFIGLSPFNAEKTPSFTVSDQKGFYHCFSSGKHGDIFRFLMETEGLSFPEAVERLANEAGVPLPKPDPRAEERERERAGLHEVLEAAAAFFEQALRSPDGRNARDYLEGRGLDGQIVKQFRIGYAPGGRYALKEHLGKLGIEPELMARAGLLITGSDVAVPFDRFRDRVIFPIADLQNRVVAFGGRALKPDQKPKYLNSPETELFHKGRVLFNMAAARRAAQGNGPLAGTIIVAEGYMDVVALTRAGFANSVAPLGTALTEDQLALLWRVADEPVLCFDGDNAGSRAMGRAAERALPLLQPEKSLRFVTLPKGEDPDSLVRKEGTHAMEDLIGHAAPLDAVVWGLETDGREIDTPERIAGLEQRLEDRALSIEDRKVQFQYRAAFRQRLRDMVNARRAPQQNYGGRPTGGQGGAPGFGKGGPGWSGQGRGGGRGWGGQPRGGYGSGGFSPVSGHATAGRGGSPADLKRRHEQVLLAVVINHPGILDMFAEDLAMVNVSDPKLDNLRQEILKVYADVSDLDSGAFRDQLSTQGNAEILNAVLSQEVYVHGRFARPDATEDEARTGFLQALSKHLEPNRRAELEEARHVFVNDPTDENWERFEKLKMDRPRVTGLDDAAF